MSLHKDEIESRLSPSDRRRIFEAIGFSFNGHRAGPDGWINGVLGPTELGEGNNPNFAANVQTGTVKDHGSSRYTGSLYDAVMDAQGLPFPQALEWIVDVLELRETPALSHSESAAPDTETAEEDTAKEVVSLDAVRKWHEHLMSDRPEAQAARTYLTGRGLDESILKGARIGLSYKPGRRSGVLVEWWIVIPVWSRTHEEGDDPVVVAMKGFAFDPEAMDWRRTPEGNKIPRNAESALYDLTTNPDRPVVLCEGELDALCATVHGFNAVTGTNGAATFKREWATYLAEVVPPAIDHGVIVCFDGDDAGRAGAPKAAQTLHAAGLPVRTASLPDGQDVSDVLQGGGRGALKKHIDDATPFELEVSNNVISSEGRTKTSGLDLLPYESFPTEALPGPLRDYVRAASNALPAPIAMVAVPTLSVLAGAIGNAARIRLKRSWHEPATLWTVLVAPSGSTKSPAFSHAVRPIYSREAEARDKYEREMADWKSRDEEGDEPKRRRYRTGDATPEAVVKILGSTPRGVLLARDELEAWIGSFDRYVNGAADLQFWIEVWQGIQASRDRAGEGNTTVDRPVVPVTGTIQPGTLKNKLDEIHFDTGFASRLVLCQPPPRPKRWTEADVSRAVRDGYERLLTHLYATESDTVVDLSREAKDAWINYYDHANASLEERPEGAAKAVAAKGITHAARLALILHLCRKANGETQAKEVDAVSMGAALTVGKWLTNETLRVYHELNLDKNALPPERRFLQRLPSRFKTSDARRIAEEDAIPESTMYEWLNRLQESGALEKIKRGLYHKP